jgi:quinoprotein glucose dehydrogenase
MTSSLAPQRGRAPRGFALLLGLLGVALLGGGAQLLSLGGSSWYAVAGIGLLAAAILLWRGSRWGAWLYGALLSFTVAWSLSEVGVDPWALVPRLALLGVLGSWILTPFVQRGLNGTPLLRLGRARRPTGGIVAVVATVIVVAYAVGKFSDATGSATSATRADLSSNEGDADWLAYGRDAAGTRYSPLGQITPANASQLELAWSYRAGDLAKPKQDYSYEATPLKVGGSLYLCTPVGIVIALDAQTGAEQWRFDAQSEASGALTCRGVTYHQVVEREPVEHCDRRIYVSTPDAKLWSVDAGDGRVCPQFGHDGAVDLTAGLGEVVKNAYRVTSPPVVARGRLIVGAKIADNISTDMPSGVIRAFDVATGELMWAWDAGRPDLKGAPPPGETYTRSTPNAWAPFSVDEELGLAYVPTGNPAVDFAGKTRRPFDEMFGSALVALDVESGDVRWHFQVTHHDVFDNDLPAQPVLVDVQTQEGMRPAVIQGTKQGDLFVLDRRTGEPIVPVTERPVPSYSDVGEPLSPTQPSSALAVNPGPDELTEAAMWGLTPLDQLWCRIQFRQARYEGPYTPPGVERPTIAYPGMFGGIEWGGVAADSERQLLISNATSMPFLVRMGYVDPQTSDSGLREMAGTGLAISFWGFLSPLDVPCMQPPWGKLYAIDMRTWRVLWERPIGTGRDSGPFGLRVGPPLLIGTPQAGGTVVTRGGVIFSSGTLDQYLRAYDLQTGRELWKARLPAGGQATPMTYEVSGKQYVVVVAGGHGILGTKKGDYVLAFALP